MGGGGGGGGTLGRKGGRGNNMKLKVLQCDMSVVTVIICHMSDLGMHACLCDNRSTSHWVY